MNGNLDTVLLWIEKADHDLGTAQITFLYLPAYWDTIAFHCQQAVEKYLKAYLVFLQVPFRKVHSLTYLLSLVSQKIEIPDHLFDKAASLEDLAVEIRYPDSTIVLSDEETAEALSIAKLFREFVITQIGIVSEYRDIVKE